MRRNHARVSHHRQTREEVAALYARMAMGGPDATAAREEMIVANLPLVRWCIQRWLHPRHHDLDDLEQAGRWGLIMAVDRYDPNRAAFSTYAEGWIRAGFYQFVLSDHLVRVPKYLWDQGKRGRIMQPATDLGVSLAYMESIDDEPVDRVDHSELCTLLDRLGGLERAVLAECLGLFGEQPTLSAIGKDLMVSRTTVATIRDRALGKLRDMAWADRRVADVVECLA